MPVPLKKDEECHDIVNDYAQAVVKALPGQEAVELFYRRSVERLEW
jgi:hypothetical protein